MIAPGTQVRVPGERQLGIVERIENGNTAIVRMPDGRRGATYVAAAQWPGQPRMVTR